MIKKENYFVNDHKSEFLFNKIIEKNPLLLISIINFKSQSFLYSIGILLKIFLSIKIMISNKLFNLYKIVKYISNLKYLNSNSNVILVYNSFDPYLHFVLFVTGFSKVICVIPYFLVERHVKCKYIHPNTHFVLQSMNDKILINKLKPSRVSILGSLHLSINYNESIIKRKYDLGFISQLTEEFLIKGKAWFNLIENINSAVLECLQNTDGELAILLRHPSSSYLSKIEKDYYNNILIINNIKKKLNFLYPDSGMSYNNIKLCDILVTINSNLGYEALSVGLKVIFYLKYELNSDYYSHSSIFLNITVYQNISFRNLYHKYKNESGNINYNAINSQNLFYLPYYNNLYLNNLIEIINE